MARHPTGPRVAAGCGAPGKTHLDHTRKPADQTCYAAGCAAPGKPGAVPRLARTALRSTVSRRDGWCPRLGRIGRGRPGPTPSQAGPCLSCARLPALVRRGAEGAPRLDDPSRRPEDPIAIGAPGPPRPIDTPDPPRVEPRWRGMGVCQLRQTEQRAHGGQRQGSVPQRPAEGVVSTMGFARDACSCCAYHAT
jgi:hypothetical protein